MLREEKNSAHFSHSSHFLGTDDRHSRGRDGDVRDVTFFALASPLNNKHKTFKSAF